MTKEERRLQDLLASKGSKSLHVSKRLWTKYERALEGHPRRELHRDDFEGTIWRSNLGAETLTIYVYDPW